MIPGSGRSLEEEMATHSSISCLEKFHGQRSLVGCSPWGLKQLNLTERHNTRTHTIFSGMDIDSWFLHLSAHEHLNCFLYLAFMNNVDMNMLIHIQIGHGFISLGLIPTRIAALYWRRQWRPTPVLLPGESHGWRSLVGCSPWDC